MVNGKFSETSESLEKILNYLRYTELDDNVDLSCFGSEIPFLGIFGLKYHNYLFIKLFFLLGLWHLRNEIGVKKFDLKW